MDPDEIPAFRKSLRNFNGIDRRRWRAYRALVRDLSIASNFGSDSLSMKFAGGVALISVENQRHASTLQPYSLVPSGFVVVMAVHDTATTTITVRCLKDLGVCPS
jgi:hypothetical protein